MQPTRFNKISEAIILFYLVFLAVLTVVFRGKIAGWEGLLIAQIVAALLLAGFVKVQTVFSDNRAWRLVRNWLPLPYVLFGYRMVHFLVNCERNPGFLPDRDGLLIAIDRFLFGVDPTVWLERITTPWLTELMQLVYATNYFLPLVLLLVLYLQRRRLPFQESVYFLTLGYFLSFLGYFLVPAIGPRFTITHSCHLQGLFLREKICGILYFMEGCPRDCFPSGHTEIPLITLWLAYRYKRGLFRAYLPIVIILICSTVYLRFHYVVDVIAGTVLAGLVIVAGKYETSPRHQGTKKLRVDKEEH